ncbi:MAG: class B sortase [Lachnospiraceae bacterium]|nr:class B sortase [Lachnospiraceae bacterium]
MKKKIFDVLRVLIVLGACGGFTFASYSLTKTYLGYQNADKAYEEINNMFIQVVDEDSEDVEEEGSQEQQQTQSQSKDDKDSLSFSDDEKWVWNYNAMREYNPESLGYIKLDESRIQYPIVQHEDNQYYLERGSNRISNGNGAIFVDSRIQGGLDAKSCIIYGHDMLNGAMFADLLKYGNKDWCDTHQVFDIYIGYRHYRYYVFASFRADALDKDIYKMGFLDDNDYTAWIKRCMSKSNYKYPVDEPTAADKTILLSTCIDDDNLRFVVTLVRGEEVVD